jgi:hypothetical protein
MRGSSACVLINAQNVESNQKLGVCGAQFRDGLAEIEARRVIDVHCIRSKPHPRIWLLSRRSGSDTRL